MTKSQAWWDERDDKLGGRSQITRTNVPGTSTIRYTPHYSRRTRWRPRKISVTTPNHRRKHIQRPFPRPGRAVSCLPRLPDATNHSFIGRPGRYASHICTVSTYRQDKKKALSLLLIRIDDCTETMQCAQLYRR